MRAPLLAGLTVLVAAAGALGQEDDPQVQEAWARWLEDPLDLREASAGVIALLPWVDHEQAALIEGLAREGALRSLEDLTRVPGLDAETIAALGPFVDLERAAPATRGWRWRWRQDETFEHRGGPRFRRTLRAEARSLEAALRWRNDRAVRGWGRIRGRGWALAGGSLRARPASALLRADPTARSRTAPVSSRLQPGAPWAGSLSSAVPSRAVALSREGGPVRATAFLQWPEGDSPSGWGQVRVERDSLAWGLAASVSRGVDGAAWWRRRFGSVLLRAEAAGGAEAWRSSAATIWTPDHWKIGLATTHAFQAKGGGSDPISRLALDREHRSWQLSLRRRWSRATVTGLARRILRGNPPGRQQRLRLRLWLRADLDPPSADDPRSRWQLLLRVGRDREAPDRAIAADPTTQVRLELRRRHHGLRERLVVARRGRAGAESRALTVQIEGTGNWSWRLIHAVAEGERSHPWAAGLPHAGLLLRWLAPGDNLALLGLGGRKAGLRGGVWIASVWSDRATTVWEGGCSLWWSGGTSSDD